MRAPGFWYARPGVAAALLSPLSLLWRLATQFRQWRTRPVTAPIPVLCVGNLVAGGAGKTPVVRDLVTRLHVRGVAAVSLSRGHGGRLPGPLAVDPTHHLAAEVGDEPLLLSRYHPAWIGRDRVAATATMAASGAGAIILDDGFQNPTLRKTLSLLVVDGVSGFGNGHVIPAGPLRETVADGLRRASALVVIGDGPGLEAARAIAGTVPVLTARLVPDPVAAEGLWGRRVLAFAGIGSPAKFFATLRQVGAVPVATLGFPDHHPYVSSDLEALARQAAEHDAMLVTTEKDAMRLPASWADRVAILPVTLCWDDPAAIDSLLDRLMKGQAHGQS